MSTDYVHILILGACKCNLISWKQDFCRWNQVKDLEMRGAHSGYLGGRCSGKLQVTLKEKGRGGLESDTKGEDTDRGEEAT